jgi:glycosyltransferase involved in cell wall biosynthesis
VKISVVIPVFNGETYLGRAITSALCQTHPPQEIIVVDDGSTDGTSDIAVSYGGLVRLIRQSNQGVACARNHGVAAATGDWIAFLDHDDEFLPDKLRRQALLARHGTLDVIYSGYRVLRADGSTDVRLAFQPQDLWPALRYRSPIVPSTALIRKNALLEVGGFDIRFRRCQDWHLWIRLVRRYSVRSFAAAAEPLAVYRVRLGSLSSQPLELLACQKAVAETVSLSDLRGLNYFLWRQRIWGRLLCDAAIALREQSGEGDLVLALRSLWNWPLPGRVVPLRRYKVLAHMLWSKLVRDAFHSRIATR